MFFLGIAGPIIPYIMLLGTILTFLMGVPQNASASENESDNLSKNTISNNQTSNYTTISHIEKSFIYKTIHQQMCHRDKKLSTTSKNTISIIYKINSYKLLPQFFFQQLAGLSPPTHS
jgi:flagellar biosynthesis protein FliP